MDSDSYFLAAQMKCDPSTPWDNLVPPSAFACTSTVDALRTRSLGQGLDRQIKEICDLLKNVFTKGEKYVKFLEHRGEAAQDLLDILQKLLDNVQFDPRFRAILYVALVRLCRKSELCPRSFNLEGVTDREYYPQSRGYFGDVYEARYKGSPVCLKPIKIYREGRSEEDLNREINLTRKIFSREAVVWGQLSHANILPFYGICYFDRTLQLVSPLVPKGDVCQFFSERPENDRTHLISGVSAGMEYLHQNGVAHGDLKCSNVLVAEPEQALLTDFGFSYVTDNSGLQHWKLSSNHLRGGTFQFEAPERVESGLTKRRDGPSDVFAFGMLCYEMFILPRSNMIDSIHAKIVYLSQLPERPRINTSRGLTNNMWVLMQACLSPKPEDRPTATQIKQRLPSSSGRDHNLNRKMRPSFEPGDATITKALGHLRAL